MAETLAEIEKLHQIFEDFWENNESRKIGGGKIEAKALEPKNRNQRNERKPNPLCGVLHVVLKIEETKIVKDRPLIDLSSFPRQQ